MISTSKGNFPFVSFAFGVILLMKGALCCVGQTPERTWLRVVTGDDSIIEVDRTSLVIDKNGIVRADFRTTLASREPTGAKSSETYQTRLDNVQFDTKSDRYRITLTALLDASGKTVVSHIANDANGWKAITGTGRLLFSAASQLAPFGWWTVKSYRYASGETMRGDDPTELTSLVGANLCLRLSYVQAFNKTCQSGLRAHDDNE